MTLVHTVWPFLILLGVLVFVHELGHFLVAKRLGIRVLKFSLGFGPKIAGKKKGETEYVVSAIPLGGYVKLYGEDPSEAVTGDDQEGSFSARPVLQRLGTVVAGPAMNFVLAFAVFSFLSLFGIPVHQAVVGQVSPDMPAARAGLQPGDRILAVDGTKIESWDEMAELIAASRGHTLRLTVERGGQEIPVEVTPEVKEVPTAFGDSASRYVIGIVSAQEIAVRHNPMWQAPWIGLQMTGRTTWLTFEFLGRLILGQVNPRRALGGPIAIAEMAGKAARAGFLNFVFLLAVLSVNLAVLNLLPIPILDGGHVLFFAIEGIRGRPVSLRHREVAQQIGLVLLLLLMAFVFYNDIARMVAG
jgi:regulator of sigma E protease